MLGFLGPNGAGKTTAVLMLATYLTPDNGEIRIDARLLKEKGHIPLIQKSIGYVPQEISLYEDMNAAENLLFFGKARNMGNLLGSVNRSKN